MASFSVEEISVQKGSSVCQVWNRLVLLNWTNYTQFNSNSNFNNLNCLISRKQKDPCGETKGDGNLCQRCTP